MASPLESVTPVARQEGDSAASSVHEQLRTLIVRGDIAPGATLNQVELAALLGVSRTPLREAIRMLQAEGFVEGQPQKRARVKEFDADQLEWVYAQRILLEGLGARLTAPHTTDADLAEFETLLASLGRLASQKKLEEWQVVHRRFHLKLVSGAGGRLAGAILSGMDRSVPYRVFYQAGSPRSWAEGAKEHENIVGRYRARDAAGAGSHLATHLARTALGIIVHLVPAYDPAIIRQALKLYSAATPAVDGARAPLS